MPSTEINKQPKRGHKFLKIMGVLILLGLLIIFYARSVPAKCTDLKCFLNKANQCAPATYEETTDIGTIDYSVKAGVDNGCTLTKQVVTLDNKENALVKKLLEGKQLECIYLKNQFNGQWMTSMIEGLDNCFGDLKDAVGGLLLLVDVK